MNVRIAKFISECGAASRRVAEEMISAGRVAINGVIINSPVHFVTQSDTVTIDGTVITSPDETRLYMFHKPLNVMTTARDPMGRKTIYDCLGDEYRNLRYVGRLDYRTTGLLLMTNNGELARKLTLPTANIPRVYIATVNAINADGLNRARHGITVDGIKYRPMQIDVIGENNLRVKITEGKKNEVRIVLRSVGCPVRKLHRISFGPIELGNLPVGEISMIPQKTVDAIVKTL
ncbi:MAG: rRNA pseudouridine synthase [Alphaproteobacteria bacterium]|nr:rRNA pseudouridine synthase [Alphaproteobacteria bacterium]